MVELNFRLLVFHSTLGYSLFLQRERTNDSKGHSTLRKHTCQRSINELQAKNKIGNKHFMILNHEMLRKV